MACLGVFAVLWALVETAAGLDTGLLHLAPALVLLLPLLCGRYVGEERLHALARTLRPPPRRRLVAALAPHLTRAPRVVAVRGGRLVGSGLALRGPPAVA